MGTHYVNHGYCAMRTAEKIGWKRAQLDKVPNCDYCDCLLTFETATIDHIKPKSKHTSGRKTNQPGNWALCCKACNTAKADREPDEAGMRLLRRRNVR